MEMNFIASELDNYCLKHSTPPSPLAGELEAYTREHVSMSIMLTGPLEGTFLGMLVRLTRATRVLEIGCYTGYSALCIAEHLPPEGRLVTLDVNLEYTAVAKRFWKQSPHGSKIELRLGEGLKLMRTLEGCFDFIFIDADKVNYTAYTQHALRLLSPTGLIAADNALYDGQVLEHLPNDPGARAIKEFNGWVRDQPNLHSVLLPIRDGIHLIWRK